ncbi:MAG: OadG family transporter subunit [Oscillospiraceae bacterium]|nr:OadG family transporter subunit [Oscillospiraceae bacterium]
MIVTLTAGSSTFSASQVGVTVLVGMLIVFAALTVIYLCMMLMERVFHNSGKGKADTVVSPSAGTVESVRNIAHAAKDEAVLVLVSDTGAASEVLCPDNGKINVFVKAGDRVRSGDRLFTLEKEA